MIRRSPRSRQVSPTASNGSHFLTIEDGIFVGSNTELVAPVRVGKDATIGAGPTITRDVPDGALAVTRVKQKHIEGYARRKK